MARTLLFLSADSFHASIWNGGKLGPAQYFSNDSNGRENFSAFLQQHRDPACLLVDVIEEDFRLETVPHLSGSARKDLLARKFEQFYRGTPFHQATLLQRQTEGRRDDEMMFSALTNPQRISPWLDTLLANRIPLIGIYSLPNISAPLIKEIPSDHVLLLSWEKDSGLRQTYFNNKRLHFSRLIPISGNSSFSESVADETPRTQQYLKSLSLPPPGETLDVYIICDANDKLELQKRLEGDNELHYTYLDIQALGKRCKARNDYVDSDATPLFLHLLASKVPSSHYANSNHTHYYWLWQLRRILFGLAGATALFSILLSGTEFLQGRDYVAQTDPLIAQTQQIKQQTQQIISSFANSTVPAADMKTAVLLARKLDMYSPEPEDILRELTLVLDKFTQVKVDKISWQASAADAAPSAYPAQVINFDGSLLGFGSEYRNALNYLDRFQQTLTQQGYTVTVLKQPLDVSSKGSISGDAEKNDSNSAQFTLKIIWREKQ
ncbi:hypothetical protein [Sideroxydans lithotrophicus]|uniref:Uncharacterized protein n=1 Tax=Sideroxydans lithotrophicus (strain ES-1) TaxID=580332 RepID=D5CNK9_SIDLE|nr:hypothetical protein [Sideroxydans lithotrophicus]ADE10922.1 conserved hypothetical protein [Sideroxydans lithotrophicus ES-1]